MSDTLPMIPVAQPQFLPKPIKLVKSVSGSGWTSTPIQPRPPCSQCGIDHSPHCGEAETLRSMVAAKPIELCCDAPQCKNDTYTADEHTCWRCGNILIYRRKDIGK
jgi:hypothetical protein